MKAPRKLDLEAVMLGYVAEAARHPYGYDERTIGRELVAVRNVVEKHNRGDEE